MKTSTITVLHFFSSAVFLALLVYVFSSCTPIKQIIVTPSPGELSDCAKACDNMARLECPGWKGNHGPDKTFGTADDISCAAVCERVTIAGIRLSQKCVARAATCDEAEQCQNN